MVEIVARVRVYDTDVVLCVCVSDISGDVAQL